jgi:hypothetical protein
MDAYDTGVLAIDTETTGLTPARCELVGIFLWPLALGGRVISPLGHGAGRDLFAAPAADTPQQPKIARYCCGFKRYLCRLLV